MNLAVIVLFTARLVESPVNLLSAVVITTSLFAPPGWSVPEAAVPVVLVAAVIETIFFNEAAERSSPLVRVMVSRSADHAAVSCALKVVRPLSVEARLVPLPGVMPVKTVSFKSITMAAGEGWLGVTGGWMVIWKNMLAETSALVTSKTAVAAVAAVPAL